MEKSEVLRHLRKFIDEKKKEEKSKENEKMISALQFVTEEGITFGDAPKYFFAYITCNSTGVGKSHFQGTETQRTVARDYVTDEHLFIDGHVGAGAKGLSLFYLKPNQTIHYYAKSDIERVATMKGYEIHSQYFRDLNFSLEDHRLNRHTVNLTKKPFTYPIRPIFATVSEKGDKITLGYVYERDGVEYIIIEPDGLDKIGAAGGFKFSPWMLLLFLFPPLLLLIPFIWIGKSKAERMTGYKF